MHTAMYIPHTLLCTMHYIHCTTQSNEHCHNTTCLSSHSNKHSTTLICLSVRPPPSSQAWPVDAASTSTDTTNTCSSWARRRARSTTALKHTQGSIWRRTKVLLLWVTFLVEVILLTVTDSSGSRY
jgi:hypothetical protein